jgi:hypothetical protein
VAARAADVASLSRDMGQGGLLQMAKAGHIRRFGKIPALDRNICGVKCTVACEISGLD